MSVPRKENQNEAGFAAAFMLLRPGIMKRRHQAAAFFFASCFHIEHDAEPIEEICPCDRVYIIFAVSFLAVVYGTQHYV